MKTCAETQNKPAPTDTEILDWLERNLISLHACTTPCMSGARIGGQLHNEARNTGGHAGPSYVRINHPTIRDGVKAAMQWKPETESQR